MGLDPKIQTAEFLFKFTFKKAPGISVHKLFQRYLVFSGMTTDKSMLIILDSPVLLGQNFGYMQLNPPVPKPAKVIKKKPKRVRSRKVVRAKKRKQ
jgi:hypothetical protein